MSELDPQQPMLYIEHCLSCSGYRKRAELLHEQLERQLQIVKPDMKLQLRLNSEGLPRRGTFEIAAAVNPIAERTFIWSGLQRERSKKVPYVEDILEDVMTALNIRKQARTQPQASESRRRKRQ